MRANDLIEKDGQCVLSDARMKISREAVWELSALCDVVSKVRKSDSSDLVIRGVTARMRTLISVVDSALGDENESTTELAERMGLEIRDSVAT